LLGSRNHVPRLENEFVDHVPNTAFWFPTLQIKTVQTKKRAGVEDSEDRRRGNKPG
jgi:hypothetical protein